MHIYFDENGYIIDREDVFSTQSPEQDPSKQPKRSRPTASYYEQKFKQLQKQSQHHQTRTETKIEALNNTVTFSCTASTTAFHVSDQEVPARLKSPSPTSTCSSASESCDPGSPSTASTHTIVGDLVDLDSQSIASSHSFVGDTTPNADMESLSLTEEDLLDEQAFAITANEGRQMNQAGPIDESDFMSAELDEEFCTMIQEDAAEAVRHLRQLEDFVDFQPWVPLPTPDSLAELEYLMAHRRPKWRRSSRS
ncbi:MAG: hypothetical protein Q9165_002169 [Trypethelium subeluteriae]